jgi:hypothetical protein
MILEMLTYTVKPGTVPRAVERFGAVLPRRTEISPLAAAFQSEVGPLNQVIMMWPYKDLAQRESCHAKKVEGWPPDMRELVVKLDVKILAPTSFSPEIESRKLGEIYEIREYTYAPGSLPLVCAAWDTQIAARQKYSSLVFAGEQKFGMQDVFVHIWAYADAAERQRIRKRVREMGVWPPKSSPEIVTLEQRNALVVPTWFSPWH